jgi:hypothetical protein
MLGLSSQSRAAPRPGQPMPQQSFGASRFLLPMQQCEFQLTGILEGLTRDPWPVANDKRPLRCTGVALSVAVGLIEVDWCALDDYNCLHPRPRPHTPILVPVSCCSLVTLLLKVPGWSSAMNLRNPSGLTTILIGTASSTSSVLPR